MTQTGRIVKGETENSAKNLSPGTKPDGRGSVPAAALYSGSFAPVHGQNFQLTWAGFPFGQRRGT